MRVTRYAYLSLFAVPALLPIAFGLGQITGMLTVFAFFPLLVLQVIVPLLDLLLGKDSRNLDDEATATATEDPFYRWMALAALPVWMATLAWATYIAAGAVTFGPLGFVGWVISTGYVGGIMAINVGHELIHKRTRLEQWAGGVLLSTVAYGGFKIEHVRGHHVNVSTPEDASSADRGQSIFHFLPRAIASNLRNAWVLEAARLRQRGLPWWHWRNELWLWTGLTLIWLGVSTALFGMLGALFFAAQALEAIISLETINYVEHYGLRRRKLSSGRYERPDPTHSWNSDAVLTNLMLLQLARHSDHHANATRRYQVLRHFDESPQLPAGYSAMFLLAWIPPLWYRVMDPRVDAYAAARVR